MVRGEIARESLKDVVSNRGEKPQWQSMDPMFGGEAGGAAHDPLDLILVAVTDARHDEIGSRADPIELGGFVIVSDEGHEYQSRGQT